MQQNSNEWLEWRKKGLGASDAPIVMGVSPWKTPLQLWEEKTGRSKPDDTNWAMQRGNALEPKARAAYELEHDMDMPPTLAQHPVHKWMRASLDGYDMNTGTILEIKCPGKEDHELAKKGLIPKKYIPQLIHQFAATEGAQVVHYWSFDGTRGTLVEFRPTKEGVKEVISAGQKFWKHVETDKAPAMTERDIEDLDENHPIYPYFKLLKSAKRNLEDAKNNYAEIEQVIKTNVTHPRTRASGVLVTQFERKGAIDYTKIPAVIKTLEENVSLDEYRKPSTTSWKITFEKEKENESEN